MSSFVFRKRPVEIEAISAGFVLDAASSGGFSAKTQTVPDWIVEAFEKAVIGFESNAVLISTLEGQMRANRADWIIRGVKGELYPCKPEIFQETYDPVLSPSANAPRTSRELGELSLFPKWESAAREMAEWVHLLAHSQPPWEENPEPIKLDFVPKPVADAAAWVLNKNEREPSEEEPRKLTPLEVAHSRLQIGITAIVQLAQNSTDHAVKLRAAEQLIETYLPLVEAGAGAPDVTPPPTPTKKELREAITRAVRLAGALSYDEIVLATSSRGTTMREIDAMVKDGILEHRRDTNELRFGIRARPAPVKASLPGPGEVVS